MKKLSPIRPLEICVYSCLLSTIVFGIWLAGQSDELYRKMIVEDGFLESLTAVLLLVIGVVCLRRFVKSRSSKPFLFALTTGMFGFLFIFGAGEEISWGQRIFNWQSSDFFIQNNAQDETNLHNLVVGETKINKLVFGKLLTLSLFIYYVILPLMSLATPRIRSFYNQFYLPFPKWHHSIMAVGCGLLILLVDSGKKGELNEISLACIMLCLFLYPANEEIYKEEK